MSKTGRTNKASLVVIALITMGFSGVALAQRYMLYTEKTYAQAGVITPAVQQAHFYEAGEVVTLVAQPYQGYEFVYWLGDVEEKTSRTTKVIMDGPRYVVAVFEPTMVGEGVEYGLKSLEEGGGRGGADSLGANSITRTGWDGVGGFMASSERPAGNSVSRPGDASGTPSPVYRPPSTINPNPVIPEPATLALFGIGALGVTARRVIRKKRLKE